MKSVHCAANGASEHCNIQRSEGRSHKQESRDTDEHVEDGLVVGWLDGWMIECEGDEWIDAKEIVVRDSLRSNILLAAGTTTATILLKVGVSSAPLSISQEYKDEAVIRAHDLG